MAPSTPPQICMTLSALAATAATPRPSGEARDQQTWRVAAGISQQLSALWLATKASWQLAWIALSPDDDNMAYIARSIDGSNQFAVVVRGRSATSPTSWRTSTSAPWSRSPRAAHRRRSPLPREP